MQLYAGIKKRKSITLIGNEEVSINNQHKMERDAGKTQSIERKKENYIRLHMKINNMFARLGYQRTANIAMYHTSKVVD